MILVTGATGTFGKTVAKHLINKGETISVASSTLEKLKDMYQDTAVPRVFSWEDQGTFADVLSGISTVYLIAPPFYSGFGSITKNFLDVAKLQGVKHVVLTTAYGANAAEGSSMYDTEQEVKRAGINYTILRPNFIFQNFVNYDLASIKNGSLFIPSGTGATSYVDIEDVGAVTAEVLKNTEDYVGKAIDITGSEALTHAEIAGILSDQLGRKIENISPSTEVYKTTMKDYGVPALVYDFMANLYGAVAAGYMSGRSSAIEDIIGKKPTSFIDYVKSNKKTFNSELEVAAS